jgi:recombinational DNA repair protein (RecF pathway)
VIVNAWGVVLSRRVHNEADRLCTLYTETHGKLMVRFVGVNKPGRKLKALSEPLCWGEYRLYLSAKTGMAKAIGGQLIGCFPGIRADFTRTVEALGCLELMQALTADHVPNPQEYALLVDTLQALEAGPSPWAAPAYGLRLLDAAGFGLPDRAAERDLPLWSLLRETPAADLAAVPFDAAAAARLSHALYSHAEAQAGRPMKARAFVESLSPSEVLH